MSIYAGTVSPLMVFDQLYRLQFLLGQCFELGALLNRPQVAAHTVPSLDPEGIRQVDRQCRAEPALQPARR